VVQYHRSREVVSKRFGEDWEAVEGMMLLQQVVLAVTLVLVEVAAEEPFLRQLWKL
jgi:hypothetical protein